MRITFYALRVGNSSASPSPSHLRKAQPPALRGSKSDDDLRQRRFTAARRRVTACVSANVPEQKNPRAAAAAPLPSLGPISIGDKKAQANADRSLLLRLAAPSYVAQAMDPVAAAVDLFWIGRLGALPLAGAAVAGAVFNSIVYLFGYLSYTTNAVVAKAIATPDPKERAASTARVAASSVILAFYVGILVAAPVFLFAPRLVEMMGAQSLVMIDAVGYLRSRSLGMPLIITFFALSGVFQGHADLSRPLYASVFGNIVNVILDPVLMFGPLAMGTFGAGIATSIACFVTVAYLFGHLVRSRIVPLQAWCAALSISKNDIAVVLVPFLTLSMKRVLANGILALASSRAARMGPAASAAMEIARQVWWTMGVLWWPLCTAIATVTSIAVAQRSDKSRIFSIAALALKLTGILGLLGGLGTALLASHIPLLFLKDKAFLSVSIDALRALAPFLAVSSVMDALDSVLIAGGDGVFNTASTGLSVIAVGVWLTRVGTVSEIWIALLVSYAFRLVLNAARFFRLYGRNPQISKDRPEVFLTEHRILTGSFLAGASVLASLRLIDLQAVAAIADPAGRVRRRFVIPGRSVDVSANGRVQITVFAASDV